MFWVLVFHHHHHHHHLNHLHIRQTLFRTAADKSSQKKNSLKYQCETSVNAIVRPLCNGLADVYYAAVRAFGGGDATPGIMETDPVLVREYEEKLAVYEAMMEQARQEGIIGA